MSGDLALRLLASGAVRRADVEAALLVHARDGVPFVRALLDARAIGADVLEQELARSDLPTLRRVVPVPVLASALPKGLCERLLAVPVRRDPYTGTVDVAVVDPFDSHIAEEVSFHLGMGVRIVRAPYQAVVQALQWLERGDGEVGEVGEVAEPARSAEYEVVTLDENTSPSRSGAYTVKSDPLAPKAPRPPFRDVEPYVERIRRSRDKDAVVDGLIRGMLTIARRVGVLVVKKGELVGLACNPEFADLDALRALHVSLSQPSVLAAAMASGSYLGPIPRTAENAPLLDVMGEASSDVAIVAVTVGDRPVLLLIADELGDTMLATQRATKLTRAAGEAFVKLLRRKER